MKYRLGGRSPETGFDCSGLVMHVFERAWGMLLPPGTAALSKVGMPVTKLKELEPGDLVFYNTRNRPIPTSASISAKAGSFMRRAPARRSASKTSTTPTGASASTAPGAWIPRRFS